VPSEEISDELDRLLDRLDDRQVTSQALLDQLVLRVDSLEGSAHDDAAAQGLRPRDVAAIYSIFNSLDNENRQRLLGSTAAAAEQLLETLLTNDGANEWLEQAVDRFVNIHMENLAELIADGPSSQLDGTLNLVRGFYAESMVLSRLRSNDLPLPEGIDPDSAELVPCQTTFGCP